MSNEFDHIDDTDHEWEDDSDFEWERADGIPIVRVAIIPESGRVGNIGLYSRTHDISNSVRISGIGLNQRTIGIGASSRVHTVTGESRQ